MVGQLYLLVYLFYQAELFPDYKTQGPALPYYFDYITCHLISLLKIAKSKNWWRIFILLIKERFLSKLKLSTLL